jgi:hypothetical protein
MGAPQGNGPLVEAGKSWCVTTCQHECMLEKWLKNI